MYKKRISVVIPTYKRPLLLRRCLTALLRQTFLRSDFDIIVVSDGPDAEAENISNSFSPYVSLKYIQTPFKKGPAAARNIGWLQASGTVIAFTDDDCIPDSRWLESIWNEYHGESQIAFSGRVIVPISIEPTDYEVRMAHLEKAEFITANCACTKQALISTGGFDERFSMAWREDSDLQFKLLSQNIPVIRINATVVHPVRKAEWGISIKEQKKRMFNALLFKKYPDLYRRRIKSRVPPAYYTMTLCMLGLLISSFSNSYLMAIVFFLCWLGLVLQFTFKRLSIGSASPARICEMLITSMIIPLLSVYWQLYGSFKYRVLFL